MHARRRHRRRRACLSDQVIRCARITLLSFLLCSEAAATGVQRLRCDSESVLFLGCGAVYMLPRFSLAAWP